MAVAAIISPAPLTYEAYLAEEPVEGAYSITEGIRIFMPGASWKHQQVVGNLFGLLRAFQKSFQTGKVVMAPFDVLIQRFPLRTRQPDVLFISNERLAEAGGIPDEGPLEVGPELVIEVLSPSETPRTLRAKLEDLARVGAREAWILSPEAETVQVMRLSPETVEIVAVYAFGQTVQSITFPDLQVTVADMFAE